MATLPPRRNLGVFCCFHWIILMTLLAERTPFLALQIKRGVGKRGGYNIARGLGLFSRGGSVKVGSSKLRRPGIGLPSDLTKHHPEPLRIPHSSQMRPHFYVKSTPEDDEGVENEEGVEDEEDSEFDISDLMDEEEDDDMEAKDYESYERVSFEKEREESMASEEEDIDDDIDNQMVSSTDLDLIGAQDDIDDSQDLDSLPDEDEDDDIDISEERLEGADEGDDPLESALIDLDEEDKKKKKAEKKEKEAKAAPKPAAKRSTWNKKDIMSDKVDINDPLYGFIPDNHLWRLPEPTTTKEFNRVIQAWADPPHSNLRRCIQVLEAMKREGVEPDRITYNEIIILALKRGRYDKCLYYVREMNSRGIEPDDLTDVATTYIDKVIQTFPEAFNYTNPDTGEVYPLSVEFDKRGWEYLEMEYPWAPVNSPSSRKNMPELWVEPLPPYQQGSYDDNPDNLEEWVNPYYDMDEDNEDLDEDPDYLHLNPNVAEEDLPKWPKPPNFPAANSPEDPENVIDIDYNSRKGEYGAADDWEDWDEWFQKVGRYYPDDDPPYEDQI
ncbi:hypothetical protein AAMO2058_000616900 [Amorphochlora amoebiformis]